MKRIFTIIISLMIASVAAVACAETLTLTTYYPAPFGAYDQIRLVPRNPQAGACTPGSMYVRNDNGNIDFCDTGATWGPPPGMWLKNGTTLYPATLTWDVGIGTTTPGCPLQVVRDLGVATGEHYLGMFSRLGDTGADAGVYLGYWAEGAANTSAYVRSINNFPLTLGTMGTQRAFTILNNGNVAIGTSAPDNMLDVRGGVIIGNTGVVSSSVINVRGDPGEGGQVILNPTADGVAGERPASWTMDNDAAGRFRVFYGSLAFTNQVEPFILSPNGNVAIGTTTSTTDVQGVIQIRQGSPGAGKVLTASDNAGNATWTFVTYAP